MDCTQSIGNQQDVFFAKREGQGSAVSGCAMEPERKAQATSVGVSYGWQEEAEGETYEVPAFYGISVFRIFRLNWYISTQFFFQNSCMSFWHVNYKKQDMQELYYCSK